MPDPVVAFTRAELSTALMAELEIGPRARILAQAVLDLAPGSAVLVLMCEGQHPDHEELPAWRLRGAAGNVSFDAASAADSGTLAAIATERTTLQYRAEDLAREDYAHLDVRQSLTALTYLPILLEERLLGCIEVVSFAQVPDQALLALLGEVAECAAVALGSALVYESERNASLSSVMRLTQLYDIEKVFNATLEMTELLPVICSKVHELTHATAVNLWMVEGEGLLLLHQAGADSGARIGDRQQSGSGIVGDVGESGEAVLFQAEEEALAQRNRQAEGGSAVSLMVAPLVHNETLVGALEAVSEDPEALFNDDDLFTLTQVADSAAQALHNSSLLQAERKIEVLQNLVSVSQEISSTLNLERVLQAIVSQPQLVIPYERAAIALEQRGKLTIQAISGVTKLDTSDPEVERLQSVLRWAAGLDTEVNVSQHGEEIGDTRPETREKFRRYFEETSSRAFYALPLVDDEGRLGVLSFESPDPDFLTSLHLEIIKILASQATLALRNASLYKEVPFIGILEPLIEKRRRFLAMEKRSRMLRAGTAAAVLLALILVPFPMRVSGDAQVAPAQTQYVRAEEDGVVANVFVREGQAVSPQMPLLQMTNWGQREALASAETRYNTAAGLMARALDSNDATAAGQRQLEAQYLLSERNRTREQLSRMTVRAQIAGTVATPHVENLTGKKLSTGDPLIEVVNTATVVVDVALPERDINLVTTHAPATIKLESLPVRTFRGEVGVISPSGQMVGEKRIFFARIQVPNADGALKPGMQGWAKVRVGARPLGYVLFRDPALWLWSKLWNWFGW